MRLTKQWKRHSLLHIGLKNIYIPWFSSLHFENVEEAGGLYFTSKYKKYSIKFWNWRGRCLYISLFSEMYINKTLCNGLSFIELQAATWIPSGYNKRHFAFCARRSAWCTFCTCVERLTVPIFSFKVTPSPAMAPNTHRNFSQIK